MKKQMGKVWLVGAGPSDIGLLTLKGKEVLSHADVVIYDRLAGSEIFSLFPESARWIDVGKQAGRHTREQAQIHEILYREAQRAKNIVRLKGGDPFLFGRGGEEAEYLADKGVDFEVVPGVTSALAVLAANGIPATHRDIAGSVHIISGHRRGNGRLDLDYETLAKLTGTLVFLMCAATMPEILQGLLRAGKDPHTGAALLMRGTSAEQEKLIATVGTLEERARSRRIRTPAILVVGEVCTFSDKLDQTVKKPLAGEKILVTRPAGRSRILEKRLKGLGAEIAAMPTICTRRYQEAEHAQAYAKIRKTFSVLDTYDMIAFTSPYGVQSFFSYMKELHMDIRRLGNVRLAAVGPATAEALLDSGLFADVIPARYDTRALGEAMARVLPDGASVLLARASKASGGLEEELLRARKEIRVTELPLYETFFRKPQNPEALHRQTDGATMVIFTSASTVQGFSACAPQKAKEIPAVCIGAQTQEAARKAGFVTAVAKEASVDAIVDCVLRQVCRKKEGMAEWI